MKLRVLTTSKTDAGSIDLPNQFYEEVRPDLIKRAVLAIQSHKRQPYGADPEAGTKYSIKLYKRRRHYRGSYGLGISRVHRKIISRSGTRFNWIGAFAPGTVGGRKAHPPKAEKIWAQKINKKERRKAIRSAIAATIMKDLVENRGHKVPENYPFIVESKIESEKKTKDVIKTLEKLGFSDELKRTKKPTIRAGKGKARGRRYITKIGPLIVVSGECPLLKSAKNIPGVDVVNVQNLNAELLAPGTYPGRLTLWTQAAIERLAKEKLFTNEYRAPKIEKNEKVSEVKKAEQSKKEKVEKKSGTQKKETKKGK